VARSPQAVLDAFGAALRSLREERSLSQEALAERAGIHRTYVSLLERGLKAPTLIVLIDIAVALDVAPSRIVRMVEVALGLGEA
jgi:transcriptional regulator with XRE-family HTH domain